MTLALLAAGVNLLGLAAALHRLFGAAGGTRHGAALRRHTA
ncbi:MULTISPECIES: hypothetical protein [Streptomyces]|uniref:Uncharacterized protein n=1 Tax=Streptomyces lienomycini TaxID=284035 RepID=A0ABV9X0D6_9ACTN|nr:MULTISPECIES: hypothetical protein [Streptomyces]